MAEGERRRPLVSVVVPAYNEAAIVDASLARICSYLEGQRDRFDSEVVVVDDGSTDTTGDLIDAFTCEHPTVRVVHHADNSLLGQALRTGFAHCRGDYVITMDCDLSYASETIGRLFDETRRTGADVVIASPYMKGGSVRSVPWFRRIASVGANRFLSLAAPGHISTLTSLVRSYDAGFLRSLDLKSHGSEINSEIIYKALMLRARVVELPADLDWTSIRADRAVRQASARTTRTTVYTLLSAFFFAPFMFFIVPGLVMLLAAVSFAAVVESVRGFVFAGVLAVVGFQLITLGLLALQAKRYFEELFHLGTTVLRAGHGSGGLSPP